MKRTERSWMYERKVGPYVNPEFEKGVDEFMQYVKDNPESSNPNEVRCPCAKCKNKRLWDPDTVKLHLFRAGFVPNYYEWMCHGERFPTVPARGSNEYREMVFDTFSQSQDHVHSEEAIVSLEEEPNAQAKHFLDLLKASERPLYEGSSLSVLEIAGRITSLKCEYNLPHRCVDGFVSLLSEAIPKNNQMVDTFYEVKNIVLQRLFTTKTISEEMTWHSKNPRVEGTMAHPSDSEAWKHLDNCFPEFASEPRNVQLSLCTDGFAPYGNPKNPKGNLDVYMQPLIEELKHLWEVGAHTYDISMKQNFNLRAAILWTVSDFPAYGMLSGWATSGKKACPYCMDKSKAFWLENGCKVSWFECHLQFLSTNHPFRNSRTAFCRNKVEKGAPPHIMSGEELWECVKDLQKATDGPESLQRLKKEKKGWFKQSIPWELPYWKHLLVRHNLDVMHIEKNFFDQLFHTVID
ncbi:uncharacterized protein LOC110702989 [Chenopodium quinoa]|uniref:uncharacterized protein LOC110702989 n=1 Tax=Chenopodium quinoa TaxID=63459 RepID=UPI000B795F9B|nr:uncharacterized protein LOC110702989 [Chenopodium quinoa]